MMKNKIKSLFHVLSTHFATIGLFVICILFCICGEIIGDRAYLSKQRALSVEELVNCQKIANTLLDDGLAALHAGEYTLDSDLAYVNPRDLVTTGLKDLPCQYLSLTIQTKDWNIKQEKNQLTFSLREESAMACIIRFDKYFDKVETKMQMKPQESFVVRLLGAFVGFAIFIAIIVISFPLVDCVDNLYDEYLAELHWQEKKQLWKEARAKREREAEEEAEANEEAEVEEKAESDGEAEADEEVEGNEEAEAEEEAETNEEAEADEEVKTEEAETEQEATTEEESAEDDEEPKLEPFSD